MTVKRLSPRRVLLLTISALLLASLGCAAIADGAPATPQPQTTASSSPTEDTAQSTPDPTPEDKPATATGEPTGSASLKDTAQSAPDPPTEAKPASPGEPISPTPLPPATWQAIPDLPRSVNTLAADPANPQVLYAGTGSTGSGSGVYKSEDGGLTWRSVSNGLPSEDVVALAFGPGNLLYAASGQHLYASADGAASWSQLAQYVGNSRGFERIAVASSNGNVLYAITVIEGAFRSDDGGYNWRPINAGLPQDGNGSFNVQAIAADPTDPDVIYAGTGWEPFNGNGVYKSIDCGETWQPANQGMMDRSVTALAVDPTTPQTVYAGTYEGELLRSTDGGATWDDVTPDQVDASKIVAILLDPANTQSVYLLCSRTGVLASADGGERWQMLGKPGAIEYGEFSALAAIFGAQPVLVMGVGGEGGWRYAAE